MATAEGSSIAELARLGCTGDIDSLGRIQHDGDTCPVHEDETIAALEAFTASEVESGA